MVNRRLKAPALLRVIARRARDHGMVVNLVPRAGKGSHTKYVIVDRDGAVLAGFGLTGHAGELSWTVLRSTEDALAPLFGARWMEEER